MLGWIVCILFMLAAPIAALLVSRDALNFGLVQSCRAPTGIWRRHSHLRPTNAQAFNRLSAARLRNRIRRDVSSAIMPDCTNWVKVRDTVSIVNPR